MGLRVYVGAFGCGGGGGGCGSASSSSRRRRRSCAFRLVGFWQVVQGSKAPNTQQ